jgi:acyl-CoA synthetase (NDP forming)
MLGARPAQPLRRVVLLGNGGGTSVLGTDAVTRAGLVMDPLSDAAQSAIAAMKLPPGLSALNPIDAPAGVLRQDDGRVAGRLLDAVFRHDAPDAVVMHLNLAVLLSAANRRADVVQNLVAAAVQARGNHPGPPRIALVLRSDGSEVPDTQRRQDIARLVPYRIPVFEELADAAEALAAIGRYEAFAASLT